MAKKQCNFRLSAEAVLAIKIQAKERHCSEADVIESWATGSSGVTGNTVACDAAVAGSSPALPTIQKDEKRAMFDELKARLNGKPKMEELEPIRLTERTEDLQNVPQAPFDVMIEGEPHRVRQVGKMLRLFYIGGDGETPIRPLAEGELEKLWEKRIQ